MWEPPFFYLKEMIGRYIEKSQRYNREFPYTHHPETFQWSQYYFVLFYSKRIQARTIKCTHLLCLPSFPQFKIFPQVFLALMTPKFLVQNNNLVKYLCVFMEYHHWLDSGYVLSAKLSQNHHGHPLLVILTWFTEDGVYCVSQLQSDLFPQPTPIVINKCFIAGYSKAM